VLDIRPATLADVDHIVRIANAAFIVERSFIDRDRTSPDEVRAMFETGAFLAGDDETGAMAACVYVEQRGDRGYFGLLSVDPAHHRRGFGRAMIDAVEAYLRVRGCRALDIRVVNLRTELPPIYAKLGFVETGTEPLVDPDLFLPAHFIRMSKPL
jgi:ribosomal protein S18 acetylase RimI-like enzyme